MDEMETDGSAGGRWLSPDPRGGDVSNPQSLNRYAYVLNNPATFVDPLGLLVALPPWCRNIGEGPGGGDEADCNIISQYGGAGPSFLPFVSGPGSGGGGGSGGTSPPSKPKIDCSHPPPKPPAAPPGASADTNIAVTMGMQAGTSAGAGPGVGTLGTVITGVWWLDRIRPFGSWDYAHNTGQSYAAFGNFNYGATCDAMGLGLTTCQRGAGAEAYGTATLNVAEGGKWTAGPGNPFGGPAIANGAPDYGDQPGTTENLSVVAGWAYTEWQRVCHH